METGTFIDVIYRTATSGQLTSIWSSLPRNVFVQIAQLLDTKNTQQIQWREFALVFVFALLPKDRGIPDIKALRKMYSNFVRADDMSPTQSAADVVEWNEYCSVTLWFEEDQRVDEDLAWQIRDLIWLIFSINPTTESRGQLPYPNVILSFCLTPSMGNGVYRSIGLYKAWQVQSVISQCRGSLLNYKGVHSLLTNSILYNPTFSMSIINQLLFICFNGDEEKEIGFDVLTTAMDRLVTEEIMEEGEEQEFIQLSIPLPFTLKDVFETIRGYLKND